MKIQSAGILLYKYVNGDLHVMLVHPGGPFWAKKDDGAWSIPKGLIDENEEPVEAAKREFKEETGVDVTGELNELGAIKQPSGKLIFIWAVEQDLDVVKIVSNTFTLEWPKISGHFKEYPEIDRGAWFTIKTARVKILKGQAGFIDKLVKKLNFIPADIESNSSSLPEK